jgi:hypothetical protein
MFPPALSVEPLPELYVRLDISFLRLRPGKQLANNRKSPSQIGVKKVIGKPGWRQAE